MVQYNFATANLSFAFALGKPWGSEAKWIKKILEEASDKKIHSEAFRKKEEGETDEAYLQARSKDVMGKIVDDIASGEIDAIGLQELNEDKGEPNPNNKDYNAQNYILNLLKEKGTVFHQHERIILGGTGVPTPNARLDLGINTKLKRISGNTKTEKKYCMISLTVQVSDGIKPTVALIYDMEKFGMPIQIEGGDFTQVPGNKGRPMLGVKTDNGFVLMVMHAPNVNPFLFGQDLELMPGVNNKLKQYYANPNIKLDKKIRKKINEFIQSQFMDPMEKEISEFIKRLRLGSGPGLKTVLMGDMNDTDPKQKDSLSNWLKKNEGLEFSIPANGTCCYNWDSSKSAYDPTQWLIGEQSHPHTGTKDDPRTAISSDAPPDSEVLKEKAQLQKYAFKGDLIYYSNNLDPVGEEGQRELFSQNDRTLTSQYSDHVFQVITLEDRAVRGEDEKEL